MTDDLVVVLFAAALASPKPVSRIFPIPESGTVTIALFRQIRSIINKAINNINCFMGDYAILTTMKNWIFSPRKARNPAGPWFFAITPLKFYHLREHWPTTPSRCQHAVACAPSLPPILNKKRVSHDHQQQDAERATSLVG
jgi:hypothetical protein